jgi:hypothetical protein
MSHLSGGQGFLIPQTTAEWMFYSGPAHYALDPADRSSNSYYSETRGFVRPSRGAQVIAAYEGRANNDRKRALFEREES